MAKNVVTNDNYYLFNDIKIEFFFDDDINGYVITEAKGNINELFIPNTINGKPIKDINGNIFWNLTGFDRIIVSEDNDNFTVIDGVLFTKDMKKLIMYPPEKKNKLYIVPEDVEEIGEDSFCNKYLKTLIFPAGLKWIIQYAIACKNLETLYIPRTLKKVYFKAFSGCDSIKEVYYQGTKEDWVMIDFTDFNCSLTEAQVHFNFNLPVELTSN